MRWSQSWSRSRPGHQLLAITTAVVLACGLAACSSSGNNGGAATNANTGNGTQAATNGPTQSADQLVAEANKEGSVVWYNTFTDKQIPKMVSAFNKEYPDIKVDAIKLSSEIVPRVTTEQRGGKYSVDLISGSSTDLSALYSEGALVKYDAPDAPQVPGVSLPSGYRNVVYVKSTVIAWNPAALKKAGLSAPTSWEDLTKPEWKGKFNIVANSSGVDFYLSLITAVGHDKALELVKALGKNKPVLGTSHTQVTTQVQAGEPVATATAYNYLTATLKQQTPERMDFLNTDPLLTTINPIVIAKNAPHPAAAKVFINWLMSKNGQQVVVKASKQASMLDGVGNDPTVWDPTKWKPAFAKADITADQYNQYVTEYTKALGYSS